MFPKPNWEAESLTENARLRQRMQTRMDVFTSNGEYSDINFSDRRLYQERNAVQNLRVFEPTPAPGRIPFSELPADNSPLWTSAEVGDTFGPSWQTFWFIVRFDIPATWAGQEVHLLFDSSSEAMVFSSDGRVLQGLTGGANRTEYIITEDHDVSNTQQKYYVEMACNSLGGNGRPTNYNNFFRLNFVDFGLFDRDYWNVKMDFMFVRDLSRQTSAKGEQALRVANSMINKIIPDDRKTWEEAREIAREILDQTNGTSQHTVFAIGHCHIDSAWLWPLAETRRKIARSWVSQLKYMERYPNFKFTASAAQHFQWIKEDYPDLYDRIKIAISNDQLSHMGGAWCECDTNMPSGESLVRQFLYGQRFFEAEFGTRDRIFWLPDCFGFSGALPQICQGVGIEYFLTTKMSWNSTNTFEHDSFLWQGIDGSQILVHFPPTGIQSGNVAGALGSRDNYKDKGYNAESIMLYGVGDGGGGPHMNQIEQLERLHDVDGLPKVRSEHPNVFFDKLNESRDKFTIWSGEMYLEFHRGVYTSVADTKRANRKGEQLLKNVEFASMVAALEHGFLYPQTQIQGLWEVILLNQFHDIIPGSGITEVNDDAKEMYAEVLSNGAELLDEALSVLLAGNEKGKGGKRKKDKKDKKDKKAKKGTRGKKGKKDKKYKKDKKDKKTKKSPVVEDCVAVNSLSWDRSGEVVECPFMSPDTALQISRNGIPLITASAPSLGYEVQDLASSKHRESSVQIEGGVCYIRNNIISAEILSSGRVRSLIDLRNNRQVIEPGQLGNNFLLFENIPTDYEAWEIELYHLQKFRNVPDATSMTIVEEGPLRAAVEFHYTISSESTMTQVISLDQDSPRLDFHTHVDWHENRQLLKVEFPVTVFNESATYEIAFGSVKRPTFPNTTWDIARFEVSAHRWADLSEYDYGVSLLNESKYGYQTSGNVMRLTLLKSSKNPDPFADMHEHDFSYALLPHEGSYQQGNVIQEAHQFNNPLIIRQNALGNFLSTKMENRNDDWVDTKEDDFVVVDYDKKVSHSFFSINEPSTIIDTVKKAEDSNDIVVRVYEAYGGRTSATLRSAFPFERAFLCNMLEDNEEEIEVLDNSVNLKFSPFKILTVKLVA